MRGNGKGNFKKEGERERLLRLTGHTGICRLIGSIWYVKSIHLLPHTLGVDT